MGNKEHTNECSGVALYLKGTQGRGVQYIQVAKVNALLNTSVADGKSTLECQLQSNPQQALDDAQLAIDFINAFANAEGQKSRLAMLATMVNKARKQLTK